MKPYLITTGILFAAITVAHAYGAITRGHLHHTDLLVLVVPKRGAQSLNWPRLAGRD